MDDHSAETNGRAGGSEPVARKLRKPYSKPSFRSEQVFETMALACGKLAGTGGSCNHVKKDS